MLVDAYSMLTGRKIAKSHKEAVYKNGFFFSSGIFAGITLNDIWRIFSLPGNEQKLITSKNYNPKLTETHMDEVYQYGLVAAVAALSLITGKYAKEIIPMAGGAILGIIWANRSEHGAGPISILPF